MRDQSCKWKSETRFHFCPQFRYVSSTLLRWPESNSKSWLHYRFLHKTSNSKSSLPDQGFPIRPLKLVSRGPGSETCRVKKLQTWRPWQNWRKWIGRGTLQRLATATWQRSFVEQGVWLDLVDKLILRISCLEISGHMMKIDRSLVGHSLLFFWKPIFRLLSMIRVLLDNIWSENKYTKEYNQLEVNDFGIAKKGLSKSNLRVQMTKSRKNRK